ncbi:hypothetical protein CJF42_11975 [Pseudoalteromonas sp. NBT06-2]|uniref:restriction endonuclease subunit S n=1 Tax=Pseudoalteromonas sp. NBT06-2 TaxID=2025950 RepID=UPI000BA53A84|nr:restriction endonuclease subunit S [Pseudoalteromonas sp. NBT06-2]PAJ74197.1 hypothetical protein CJF42_11975 [Pseudoalteromonas sp. NBT06-2]
MSSVKTILLKNICNFEKGSTGLMKAVPGEYPLVTTGKCNRTCESYQFDTKAVCIPLVSSTGHGHASLNNVHYQEGKFALGTILVAITAKDEEELDVHFLHLYLSQLKDIVLVPLMKGAANVSLSIRAIKEVGIPLPAIERQRQIVSKFKSIELEERELLDELYYQQELMTKFWQQSLQETVTGQLTAKWRKEIGELDVAGKVLDDINVIKEKLIKKNEIKKQKELLPIKSDDIPYNLPSSWQWCRLGELFNFIDYRGKTPVKSSEGIRLITAKNIRMGYINEKPIEYIAEKLYRDWMVRGFPKKGDLLFVTEGHTMGFIALNELSFKFALAQRTINLQPFCQNYSKWVFYFIMSPYFQKVIKDNATGAAATGLKSATLKNLLIPMPSLSEQKIILEKLDEITSICERINRQITLNQSHAQSLMTAVLMDEFSQIN